MNDDTNLPEDDRDLDMAHRIGESLERGSVEGTNAADEDEPFFDALLGLRRRAELDREHPSEDATRRVWAQIDEATRPARHDRPPLERVVRHTPRWVWTSVAATLLIGGIIAVFMLSGPDATLVAAAGAESVHYTAADGSVITLRPHSDLYMIEQSTRYRLDGEAFFAVTTRDGRPFTVEAGEAVVEVLGTRFNLNTWGGTASVYLEEGRIRFAHIVTGADVILDPGQASRLTAEGGIDEPAAGTADEHLDWLNGTMQFRQQPITLVAAELAQHWGVDLEIPETVRDETLTGRIPLGDRGQSLEDLGQVMGGHFVQTGSNAYRFEPE